MIYVKLLKRMHGTRRKYTQITSNFQRSPWNVELLFDLSNSRLPHFFNIKCFTFPTILFGYDKKNLNQLERIFDLVVNANVNFLFIY